MANEIKNFRSALVQVPRNKAAYTILIWEIIIFGVIGALAIGYQFHSDKVTIGAFIGIMCFMVISLAIPDLRILLFILMGIGWASPFILLGAYLLGFIAFVVSCFVHYFGITFLNDLVRDDD